MSAVSEFLSFLLSTRGGGGGTEILGKEGSKLSVKRSWWPFLSGCRRQQGLFLVTHSGFPRRQVKAFTAGTACEGKD